MRLRPIAILGFLSFFAFGSVACGDTEEEPVSDGTPEPDPMPDPQPDGNPTPTPDPNPAPQPDPQPDAMPDPEPAPQPDPQPEPEPDPQPDPQPDAMPDPMPDPEPEQMNGLCPPEGPFGSAIGDTAPDFTLTDCDGNPHSLHELCSHKVSWIFEFALWCPPCRTFARSFQALVDRFDGEDVGIYFVISNDGNFQRPTAQTCREVVQQFGLTNTTVLFDPDGTLNDALDIPTNDINVLMTEGNVIQFRRQHANNQVESEVRRLLAE